MSSRGFHRASMGLLSSFHGALVKRLKWNNTRYSFAVSHPSTNYVTKNLKWFVIKVFYYIVLLSIINRIYRNHRIYRKLSYLSELSDLSEFIGFIGIYRFYRNYRIVKIYRKLFANNSWDRIIRVRIIRITNNSVRHLSELSESE